MKSLDDLASKKKYFSLSGEIYKPKSSHPEDSSESLIVEDSERGMVSYQVTCPKYKNGSNEDRTAAFGDIGAFERNSTTKDWERYTSNIFRMLHHKSSKKKLTSGSTASMTFFDKEKKQVVVANAGDSPVYAVIKNKDGTKEIKLLSKILHNVGSILAKKHQSPAHQAEYKRLEKEKAFYGVGSNRLGGVLEVARGIGTPGGHINGKSCDPSVAVYDFPDAEKIILIQSSDGFDLGDHLKPPQATVEEYKEKFPSECLGKTEEEIKEQHEQKLKKLFDEDKQVFFDILDAQTPTELNIGFQKAYKKVTGHSLLDRDSHDRRQGADNTSIQIISETGTYAVFDGHGGDQVSKLCQHEVESIAKIMLKKSKDFKLKIAKPKPYEKFIDAAKVSQKHIDNVRDYLHGFKGPMGIKLEKISTGKDFNSFIVTLDKLQSAMNHYSTRVCHSAQEHEKISSHMNLMKCTMKLVLNRLKVFVKSRKFVRNKSPQQKNNFKNAFKHFTDDTKKNLEENKTLIIKLHQSTEIDSLPKTRKRKVFERMKMASERMVYVDDGAGKTEALLDTSYKVGDWIQNKDNTSVTSLKDAMPAALTEELKALDSPGDLAMEEELTKEVEAPTTRFTLGAHRRQ